MKQILSEYGLSQASMVLYCDNMNAINISKNFIQHSRTKHIDICHHFICELVEINVIHPVHVRSSMQLADILTKPLETSVLKVYELGLVFAGLVPSNYCARIENMCLGFLLLLFILIGPSLGFLTHKASI